MLRLNANRAVQLIGRQKGLRIPPEGWNARNFALFGTGLMLSLHSLAIIAQAAAQSAVAQTTIQEQNQQMERALNEAAAAGVLFLLMRGWARAIDLAMEAEGEDLMNALHPRVMSVAAQGYSRTAAVLVLPTRPPPGLATKVTDHLKRSVEGMNATTREQLLDIIRTEINDGDDRSTAGVTRIVRRLFPRMSQRRALTTARTELNRAWATGTALAIQQDPRVTHISVIGCKAREANSPHYRGESTCNIRDVPIGELDALLEIGWHPNHGGSIVPSRYRQNL